MINNSKKVIMKALLSIVLIVAISMGYTSQPVFAATSSSSTVFKFSESSKSEIEDFMEKFVVAVMHTDKTFMVENKIPFNNVYDLLYSYVTNNNVGGDGIAAITVDVSDYSGNSTNDMVIMVNAKISYSNGKYNKAYLYEFHVDNYNTVYAYNVWCY
jgi:hypothetical protein